MEDVSDSPTLLTLSKHPGLNGSDYSEGRREEISVSHNPNMKLSIYDDNKVVGTNC